MALLELLGENSFDQGFTICMAWLTIEVATIVWDILKMGATMLIAKTSKPFLEQLAERVPLETLEAIVEKKRRKAQQGKGEKSNGKPG